MLKTKQLRVQIGNKLVCDQLDLHVRRGDRLGILGPNGSGKTTLLQTLLGLHPAASGEILIDEKNLQDFTPKQRAHKIGLLFQDTEEIFPQTVFEFCLAGRFAHTTSAQENKDIVTTVLHHMHLQDFIQRKVHTLSGGERQRLAIAALLAQMPDIFLLDEITNHLDLRYQIHVLNYFKNFSEKSIVLSLHDVNFAEQFCTHVLLLLDNGETLLGTPHEVFTQKNLTRLYGHSLYPVDNGDNRIWTTKY